MRKKSSIDPDLELVDWRLAVSVSSRDVVGKLDFEGAGRAGSRSGAITTYFQVSK